MGVYGEADEYAYLQYGNGDDLGDFLGKYNLDPPKLPGTTPTHLKNNSETIILCLTIWYLRNIKCDNFITITPEANNARRKLHEEMQHD